MEISARNSNQRPGRGSERGGVSAEVVVGYRWADDASTIYSWLTDRLGLKVGDK